MKHFLLPLYLLFLTFIITSCEKEDLQVPEITTGNLSLSIALQIEGDEMSTDNFELTIFNTEDKEVAKFNYAEEKPDLIELEPGTYYAIAQSPQDAETTYYGMSNRFTIEMGKQENIKLLLL